MRFEGSLQSWNDDRGFGFIAPDQGGDEVFVHVKSIVNLRGRPVPGQRFSFEIELGPQGKKRAKDVLPVREPRAIRPAANSPAMKSPAAWGTATLFVIPGFLLLYLGAAILWRPPGAVALLYLGMSALAFAAYAGDKAAAKRGAWRTPERALHVLALAGGWPGALIAQQLLRHKSTKAEFRAVFWATVVLNVAAFVLLCSPWARQLLAR